MSEETFPFERYGIPAALIPALSPEAPVAARLAAARGGPDLDVGALLGVCLALAQDPAPEVRQATAAALRGIPEAQVLGAIGQSTPTALLDLLVLGREPSLRLDAFLMTLRNTSDASAIRIAERADAELCQRVAANRERLLMTPRIYVALHGNPACDERTLDRAASFLRMNRLLPEAPATRPGAAPAAAAPGAGALEMFELDGPGRADDDLFHGLDFEFSEDMASFSWEMTDERGDSLSDEEMNKLEKKIGAMSVGQRVRLAHVGNKQVRGLLLRDRNKQVAVAVVKSGRLTDGEVAAVAANRNIEDDVLREVATNREWLRKYPVQVALVNNPKTPPSIGVRLVNSMQKKDLQDLTRNHNITSVIRQTAIRLFKQKYRSEGGQEKG